MIEYLNIIQIFAVIIKYKCNFNWSLEYKRIVSTSPINEESPEKLVAYINIGNVGIYILKTITINSVTKYFQYCVPIRG